MSNGIPARCPLCGALWIGRTVGSGRVRPAVCCNCLGGIMVNSWPAPQPGFTLRVMTPSENDAALADEAYTEVLHEVRLARDAAHADAANRPDVSA